MSPVERAKQINVYLVRMDLLRLLSVGVNLRIIFTGEKPRVAQHVGNRPRLLSVGETQSICGLRSCEQYDRWSSQARRKSPSAVEKQERCEQHIVVYGARRRAGICDNFPMRAA